MTSETKTHKTTFVKAVVVPSLIFIIGVSVFSIVFPSMATTTLEAAQTYIFTNLNWVFVLTVTVFIVFLVFLGLSKYGKIRLGADNEKPEYSFFSWISMLFAAGMGIGLMYFGVAEPMAHYTEPSLVELGLSQSQLAKDAQLYTFFHWGIHIWAIYGLVGLSLAYFAYRYKLPLSLRSCFYPLLKDKVNGKFGNLIDVFALCSTFFGLTTTLGFGVVQLSAGLESLGVIPSASFGYQILIVAVVMLIAIISASTGLSKGVKNLSRLNIIIVVLLMAFVLFLGPTVYLLGSFSEGLGYYMNNFLDLTFKTYTFEPGRQAWYHSWTIVYWAWWISWAPYVGLFIAQISKGRTVRQFIAAVMILPTIFNFMWMTIFGNTAIWVDQNIANGALSAIADNPDILLFKFFEYFPFSTITSALAVFAICIFFVTSADSGIFVMNSVASNNNKKTPLWQNIFWGALIGALSLILLNLGGLKSLQTMTLITALPFTIIMLLFCHSLFKGLYVDEKYYSRNFSPSTEYWSGVFWKERLNKILTYGQRKDIDMYLLNTVLPAFNELAKEFKERGIEAIVTDNKEKNKYVEITIEHGTLKNFSYGVKTEPKTISDFLVAEVNAPQVKESRVFIPVTFFSDDRLGYDIQYFTKEEVINDVLKQYERFLSLIEQQSNVLYASAETLEERS